MAERGVILMKEAKAKTEESTFGSFFGFAPSKAQKMEEAAGELDFCNFFVHEVAIHLLQLVIALICFILEIYSSISILSLHAYLNLFLKFNVLYHVLYSYE